MLSAEIDRNPFLILQLHGLVILKELTKAGITLEKEMDIPDFKQLLQDNPPENDKETKAGEAHCDLSRIAPQTENLLSLLDTKSVFCDKPFVPLLRKNYKAVSRHSKV